MPGSKPSRRHSGSLTEDETQDVAAPRTQSHPDADFAGAFPD